MIKLNLANLSPMDGFDFVLDSLGDVVCVSLKTSHLVQVEKKIAEASGSSLDIVRWLFGEMVRRPLGNAPGTTDQADSPRFTAVEVTAVTDADLAIFADRLIQKNKSLLLKADRGGDLEQAGDESACDFLVRAFRHYAVMQKAQWRHMTQSVSESLSTNSALEALERSTRVVLFGANPYPSATIDADWIAKRHRDILLEIDTFADVRLGLKGSVESLADLGHFDRAQDVLRAVANSSLSSKDYYAKGSILAKDAYLNDGPIKDAVLGLAPRDAMYRLPLVSEVARLLDSYQVGAVTEFAQRFDTRRLDLQRSLEAIRTPWLNELDTAKSIAGALELRGIGTALRTTMGFDPGLTAALRFDLGDWRDKITFPELVFVDPVVRTDFYVKRGFNTALTDFPESAFHQNLRVAGLDGETLDFEFFGQVIEPSADPEEEVGLQRTNKCHDRLQRFERQLRQFIDDAMTAQYGPDWPRKRLARKLYEDWEFKKHRAESNGITLTYIEVADFADYETIICKQDHWREVFETRFKKKESVRESFQRLQPIRVTTMHGRIVTNEDELYLAAETARLLSAIK
jgi:hypothetical protein